MQMITLKVKPRQIFGAILVITGVLVIVLTFLANHSEKKANAGVSVPCATAEERRAYLKKLGYTLAPEEQSKTVIIPKEFNEVYTQYNEIQKQQGFDLARYKGRNAVLYTYRVTNYKNNDRVIADLMVCDGQLIGADLCDPSADDGFLIALGENDGATG